MQQITKRISDQLESEMNISRGFWYKYREDRGEGEEVGGCCFSVEQLIRTFFALGGAASESFKLLLGDDSAVKCNAINAA